MEGLFFLLIAGGIFLALWGASVHRKKRQAVWRGAAEVLGLAFTEGGLFARPRMEGIVDGHPVVVDLHVVRHGKNSQAFTRYDVGYRRPLPVSFQLTPQHALSGVARFFGAQDIEVGDPEFDQRFMVKGSVPEDVVAFFTPSRRLRVMRLVQGLPGCEVSSDGILWRRRGSEMNRSRLTGTVRRMVRVAGFLGEDPESARSLDRAMEQRRQGRLSEALEQVRATTAAGRDPEARLLEGEILYDGGRYREAEEVLRRGMGPEEDDPEMEAWARRAQERASAVEDGASDRRQVAAAAAIAGASAGAAAAHRAEGAPEASPGPHPGPAAPAADAATANAAAEAAPQSAGPDSLVVCEELFAPEVLSFDAKRRFEERYEGARVRWSGKLKRVERYAFDMVFGNEPGTRLVIELHEIQGGILAHTVQAIASLPPDAKEILGPRTGQEVTVTGRLVSCDPFMRNLFLAEAQVA